MVVVEIKDPYGKAWHLYIDGVLKANLDKYVVGRLTKTDDDVVFIIDGPERSGKSTLATQIAKYVDPSLNIDRICMTPDEFRTAIENAKHGQCIIYDEAFTGLSSRRTLSEVNHIITQMFMEMGQKNLVVIVVLPTFFMLDKYVALFRARGLFHVYRKGTRKGFFMYFNAERKRLLYLKNYKTMSYKGVRSNFKGRFLGKYMVDEAEYRAKKKKALEEKWTDKREMKYIEQRNKLIYMIWREFCKSKREMETLCNVYGVNLTARAISTIVENLYPTLEPYAVKKKREMLAEQKMKEQIKSRIAKERSKIKEELAKEPSFEVNEPVQAENPDETSPKMPDYWGTSQKNGILDNEITT